jgi:hypothetical protein
MHRKSQETAQFNQIKAELDSKIAEQELLIQQNEQIDALVEQQQSIERVTEAARPTRLVKFIVPPLQLGNLAET